MVLYTEHSFGKREQQYNFIFISVNLDEKFGGLDPSMIQAEFDESKELQE